MAGPAVRGLGTLVAGAVPGLGLGLERPRRFVGEGERRGSPAAAWPSPCPRVPALSRRAAGVVVQLGAASGPRLPASNRQPLQASGEAVFDLHFLLSHGARAAPSSVTSAPGAGGCSADPPAFPRPSPRLPPPQGGFPAALPALRPRSDSRRHRQGHCRPADRPWVPVTGVHRRAEWGSGAGQCLAVSGGGSEARPRVALWKRGNG